MAAIFGCSWIRALGGGALLAAVAIASSCSSDGEALIAPCNGELEEFCGESCTLDGDCADGLHCGSDGTCTAECVPGSAHCGPDEVCTSIGQCAPRGPVLFGADASTGGPGSVGDGAACVNVELQGEGLPPSVLIVADQSGSMDESFGNGTRWSVLQDALMNQNNGIVWTMRNRVRFGLMLYTSHDGFEGGECPILQEVPIAFDNYDAIDQVYGNSGPDSDTPTAEAIEAGTATLDAFDEPGPKYILLVTDGLPDRCEDGSAHDVQSQQGAVSATQDAFDLGINLIPMGLSADITDQGAGPGHLQDLANAGAGLPVGGSQDARYYVAADDPTELAAQFEAIVGGFASCTISLYGSVSQADMTSGQVFIGDEEIPFDDTNGWRFVSESAIELVGDACNMLQGADDLRIIFPCGVEIEPIE